MEQTTMKLCEDMARELDGSDYHGFPSREVIKTLRQSDLVIAYGASDDLIELDGAIAEETGAFDGGIFHFNSKEFIPDDKVLSPPVLPSIKAEWCPSPSELASWVIDGDFPHAKFTITENGKPFCRAIVFHMEDVAKKYPAFLGGGVA